MLGLTIRRLYEMRLKGRYVYRLFQRQTVWISSTVSVTLSHYGRIGLHAENIKLILASLDSKGGQRWI